MNDHVGRSEDLLQLVSFVIENEEFGINILNVREIIRPLAITRLPNAPAFDKGVINLRGRIIPVVDLRVRFGLPKKGSDKKTRIIVVEFADNVIGFLIDAIKEVIRVNRSVLEQPPDLTVGIDAPYIKSVAMLEDQLLILLDLQEVLTHEQQVVVQTVQSKAAPQPTVAT